MAITQEMCNSFKTELLTGEHNFTASSGHTFKIALFTSSATLNKSTTAFSSTNETSGTGYSSGVQRLPVLLRPLAQILLFVILVMLLSLVRRLPQTGL